MKWTVGTKIGSGFGIALLILVAIGTTAYRSMNKLADAAQWVTHTHEVLGDLSNVLQALIDAETGQRGYLLTGQEVYLEPYEVALAVLDKDAKDVRALTHDNPRQQKRLDALEPMLRERIATLKGGLEARRTNGLSGAVEWISTGRGKSEMDQIRLVIADMHEEELGLLADRTVEVQATTDLTRLTIMLGTIVALLISAAACFVITRSIAGRLREITEAAKKIAAGDLTGSDLSSTSRDEIGELTVAFTTMRSNLAEMTSQVRQATENVNSTAAEILAATQQQAAAAKEQAATIQQITSTMEEITQSGDQIGDRAKTVSGTVEATSTATQKGMKATQDASQTMEAIRDQVEEVAENVVGLSERTQTIGEIIATVSEIAEQSNLLALNASIEAVSAGDQGGRFLVVAHEMKNLADRAKDCTVQVRTILGEIQKGINTSVMLTEEAVKRADGGKSQAHATETTIREVVDINRESIQAFQQIVAGTNQQQIGVGQVTQGMQDIRQAVKQTAASTLQLEKAAAGMNALSQQLHRVVERYRV